MAELTGMKEFEAAIAKHLATLSKELPQIVLDAAAPIEAAIDRRLPRLSGDLDQHLETIGTSTAQSAAAVVQIAESALGEIEEKAVFLEFGTSKMPAEPSFRPGFEEAKDRAAEILIERIAGVINK